MPEKINGGFYIKARAIQESKIATAPPYIREIWDWLLKECNHTDTKNVKRGECIRTFNDIQDGLCWYAGWRKEKYSKWQCEKAMAWLRTETMIATTKTTRGLRIKVLNYGFYQDPKNYESNRRATAKATVQKQSADTINNNDKNDKNDKNINIDFEIFWDLYDKKRGSKTKLKSKWDRLSMLDQKLILDYIPKYKKAQPDKTYRKDPQTFLNNESWKDEIIMPKEETHKSFKGDF